MRVISGHTGWVEAVAVDPSNDWFATGSADRTIKIWCDVTSGFLLMLTCCSLPPFFLHPFCLTSPGLITPPCIHLDMICKKLEDQPRWVD